MVLSVCSVCCCVLFRVCWFLSWWLWLLSLRLCLLMCLLCCRRVVVVECVRVRKDVCTSQFLINPHTVSVNEKMQVRKLTTSKN